MSADAEERSVRAASIRAFDCRDTLTLLAPDGTAREFRGESALLVRELLAALRTPRTLTEVLAHLETVASGVSEAREAIDQALALLRQTGTLIPARAHAPSRPSEGGRLVLGVCGAIAAAHTPALTEKLVRRGFEVRVALTRVARRFVRAEPLQAITHHRVHASLFSRSPDEPAPHIALAEWADLVLVAPATATTIARIAGGSCADVVSAVALSTRAPVVVAPSMNSAMLTSAPIARNVAQLVDDGFFVAHGATGHEVADAPEERRPKFGAWPALDDLVAVVEHVHARTRPKRDSALTPAEAERAWEAAYRDVPPERLPFHSEQLDADLREVLERVPRPATLWDIGAGLGTVARESARLGFAVTGTDISPQAVALATARAADPAIRLLVDDIRRSSLEGAFDVVVDRGCLHTLGAAGARAYAHAVEARTHPGSLLVLKVHREDEPREWHTVRYRLPELEALFAPAFQLVRWSRSTLPGPEGPPAQAWLAVFERRASSP